MKHSVSKVVNKCQRTMDKKRFTKNQFFRFFGKIYYLKKKEEDNISIDDYLLWKNNDLYDDFFEKANKLNLIKTARNFSKSNDHKKKLYELFKYTVS